MQEAALLLLALCEQFVSVDDFAVVIGCTFRSDHVSCLCLIEAHFGHGSELLLVFRKQFWLLCVELLFRGEADWRVVVGFLWRRFCVFVPYYAGR